MGDVTQTAAQQGVKRIGIILSGFEKANISALRFLILRMNALQRTFEYEFLPTNFEDGLINYLSSKSPVSRDSVKEEISSFIDRYQQFLERLISGYQLKEPPSDYFVLVTMARFSDNFYSTRRNRMSVLALGNWKRYMAPPSILEFILTLIVREAVASVSPSLRGSIHLGTKGCLFDFTPTLGEVRLKVLNAFVCNYCRNALQNDGYPTLADELVTVLGKQWLGKSTNPNSPAGIVSKLGYDLFTTKGLEATSWEKFVTLLQQEGVKQLITIIGGIILAGLLLWLGLK